MSQESDLDPWLVDLTCLLDQIERPLHTTVFSKIAPELVFGLASLAKGVETTRSLVANFEARRWESGYALARTLLETTVRYLWVVHDSSAIRVRLALIQREEAKTYLTMLKGLSNAMTGDEQHRNIADIESYEEIFKDTSDFLRLNGYESRHPPKIKDMFTELDPSGFVYSVQYPFLSASAHGTGYSLQSYFTSSNGEYRFRTKPRNRSMRAITLFVSRVVADLVRTAGEAVHPLILVKDEWHAAVDSHLEFVNNLLRIK